MPSLSLDAARARAAALSVLSYDVSLDLSGDDRTFGSTTTVRLTARESGETFLDVDPQELRAVRLDGAELDVRDLRGGRFPLALQAGEHEVTVEAVMSYRHDGEGLHRAVDPADGRHYTYAMSFLDAAPRIFACFDQPDLKAPYTLHVTTPEDWVVVGNGRAEQVEAGRWELATTPPLSTYFVTLVAGPYHQVRAEHDGITLGLECRASLAPYLDRDAEEILTITRQCFDEFHRLFGVRYAFGDYHQAFVPEFNAGAMENPGCVTFRDPLVFTSRVTRAERVNRATTIAHEMAHQWFGDLVTPRWWDDLWLNESFAEYMGTRVAADATEFSDAWVDAAFKRRRWGVESDQRPSTHPVAGNGATDARAALQDFDGISYAKGAAVLKQLNARIGDEVFLAGAREHFRRHRFGNATMHDLFEAWEAAGAGDLSAWTTGWLRTAGIDLLRLDRSGPEPVVVRTAPADHPAAREHALSVARHEPGQGWVREPLLVREERTPARSVGDRPVVLDPDEETWARFALDPTTTAALPELLPRMTDPVMRAAVWNTVRDAVGNALLDPRAAMELVRVALPHEDQDAAVATVALFATGTLVGRLLPEDELGDALTGVHEAAARLAREAETGSGVQLAAVRALVASSVDGRQLRGWLEGRDLPEGVALDLDLRWRVLGRLAVLGGTDRDELASRLEEERTAQATVHQVRCLASLPDKEAKEFAWARFTGEVPVSNYELEAAGTGMWQRSQQQLTAPYVERYFAEVAETAQVRSGWMLADAAREFFPRLAIEPGTVRAADRVLGDPSLDLSLRRALVDCAHDLRRDLRVREEFG